jgi:acyl transferase domain-containing protein/acyl-CoA synthetase (AMP-forming)/AMP-acid ligase II
MTSLVELFLTNALKQNPVSFYYLRNAETLDGSLTHYQLAEKSKRLAAWLIANGFSGQRAMLVFPPGLEFVEAFMACLIAKVIAVPVAPAPLTGDKNKVKRMLSIMRDCQPAIVLGVTQTIEKAPAFVEENPEFDNITWFSVDTFSAWESYAELNVELPHENDIALLQYTSGSTSQPKGVMLSHKNILHNLSMWDHGLGHGPHTKMMCWVPHFHDLGLLYGVLFPLYKGVSAYLMPAAAIVQKPARWLQAISKYRGTHSMGPNFIYEYCVDRISDEESKGLDLSSWSMSLNAAEPIRFETIKRFNEKFGSYGLSQNTLTAAYGLAESTCLVTGQRWDAPMRSVLLSASSLNRNLVVYAQAGEAANEIVCCGAPVKDIVVKIVDVSSGMECPPGVIGEIWVHGHSVSSGYWNRPAENICTFGAKLQGEADGLNYMRTGDLGFFDQGEIFTTGRVKDLIIVRGENYYPQDAEWVIEQAHPAFKPSCCAVFSVESDKEEKIVVVQELIRHSDRWSHEEMFAAVRLSVGSVYDLPIESIVLIRPGTTAKTSSGKIQRGASKVAYLNNTLQEIARWDRKPSAINVDAMKAPAAGEVEAFLITRIAEISALPITLVDPLRPFAEFGLGSLDSTLLAGEIAKHFGLDVSPTAFYDFPCIRQLAQQLTQSSKNAAIEIHVKPQEDVIVVVGIACRFPGAENKDAYWKLLSEGGIATASKTRGDGQVRHGGFLDNVASFDNEFFSITNREAACLDPQQRIALELAWQALEDADIKPNDIAGSNTGVFFGASAFDYGSLQLSEGALDSYSCQGSVLAVIANRIAYQFDLRGPSFVVDTACSSGLTALHLACRSLRDGECNTVLSGAINLILAEDWDIPLTKAGMLSPDGSCKTFDAAANGYVRGEGCGVLVLKRYADAIKDNNRIYGSILGSAINQDGRSNGLTAPNGNAQEALLRTALNNAQVNAAELGYIEAHGTGTPLGDPIECRALRRVIGEQEKPCYVGSVKGNIGHLEAAAGMAGVIKTLLSIHNDIIPAQVNFNELNPLIDLGSALAIPKKATAWPRQDAGRRCASVSAFGFSGSNACVVVSDAPRKEKPELVKSTTQLLSSSLPFILTARDKPALQRLAAQYINNVPSIAKDNWPHFLYTTACKRTSQAARFFAVVDSPANLSAKLQAVANGSEVTGNLPRQNLKIAFVFSGQGIPLAGVGRELYERMPAFKDALNQCDVILQPLLGYSLATLLYGDNPDIDLSRPGLAQSVQFSLQYALTQTFQAFGVRPDIVMGHSLGEYAALVNAGAMPLDVALRLVAARGDYAEKYALPGEMAAIFADEATVKKSINMSGLPVDLAAINGSHHCVVAGSADAINAFCTYISAVPKRPSAKSLVKSLLPLPIAPAQRCAQMQGLDALLGKLLFAQLSALGLFANNPIDLVKWQRAVNMPSMYERWLQQSIRVLVEQGYLLQNGNVLTSILQDGLPITSIWNEWEQQKNLWVDDPQLRAQMLLVDTALKALPEILQNKVLATSVIFPNGSLELVEGIYKNTKISDYFNSVLGENLIGYVQERIRENPDVKIRLIEIGAGTGGTSALLFDQLAPYAENIGEYCYTDISNSFLLHAREKFLAKAPYLITRLFNVEAELAGQAMDAGIYDVVIATNVLHATKDMHNTLRNCKALLKAEGQLMINEISDFSLFTHMSFGMLEGWWLHSDHDLRIPGSPALAPNTWRDLLEEEGFVNVQSPAEAAHSLGQQIVIAESNGLLKQAHNAGYKKLKVERAYHSALIEPAIAPFTALAQESNFFAPYRPLISNVTGEIWPTEKRLDAEYLASHLRQPVRFSDSLDTLKAENVTLAIEIGSKPVLCSIGQTYLKDKGPQWIPSLRHNGDDWRAILECLGQIFAAGSDINWSALYSQEDMHSVALPPYSFTTSNHWFKRNAVDTPRNEIDFLNSTRITSSTFSTETSAISTATVDATVSDNLTTIMARLIHMPAANIDRIQSFFEIGIDSISLMEFIKVVEDTYKIKLTVSEIFELYPSIDLVSKKLEKSIAAIEEVS